MLDIEQARLDMMGHQNDSEHGFIIPIVIRSKDRLPSEIKNQRHFYDFEDFLQNDADLQRPEDYFLEVRNIANYIAERYWELIKVNEYPCGHCSGFSLPTHEQALLWLKD